MALQYNERSWAIDVIAEIKSFVRDRDLHIKEAGGEETLTDEEGSLFPDVILYSDTHGLDVIQGWELKIVDVPITDQTLIDNAKTKARSLSLNSFLLWNVNNAALYVSEDGLEHYTIHHQWSIDTPYPNRQAVKNNKEPWVIFLHSLIRDINQFFEEGVLTGRNFIEAFAEGDFVERILENVSTNIDLLQNVISQDGELDAEITLWWNSVSAEYPEESNKLEILSRLSFTGWINKIIFANVLKRDFNSARAVEDLSMDTTVAEAIEIIQAISTSCDFFSVFRINIGEKYIASVAWNQILQLNNFFKETDVSAVGHDVLHKLLQASTDASRRKSAGQFVTPRNLAEILARTTILDKTKIVLDPCCGTGTIARAAYDIKREFDIPQEKASQDVWASDKFSYPLQVASIAMAQPENMGVLLRVFQKDLKDLSIGCDIQLQDPNSGEEIHFNLPEIDFIVSNLPFVQFEHVAEKNPTIRHLEERLPILAGDSIELDGRSDLYAYIPFYFWMLLNEGGKIGIILSNSWLGTEWGEIFVQKLSKYFRFDMVIISGSGRWFQNTDVVGTIVVLEKRSEIQDPLPTEITKFITIKQDVHSSQNNNDLRNIAASIIASSSNDYINVNSIPRSEIGNYERYGMSWSALFTNLSWLSIAQAKLIPANEVFEIKRGIRKGKNEMFYPKDHDIEPQYIRRVLKRPANIDGLIAHPQVEVFCCSASRDELRARGHTGALEWIARYSYRDGNPIPQSIQSTSPDERFWYEISENLVVDAIVVPINPYERLFFSRLAERSLVDQRFTMLKQIHPDTDVGLCHALLNSIIGLFYFESLGFGRGLGALDTNTSKVRSKLHILNPDLLSAKQSEEIQNAFRPLLVRPILTLQEEIEQDDRQRFDNIVLRSFELDDYYTDVKTSLLDLHKIRLAVKERSN